MTVPFLSRIRQSQPRWRLMTTPETVFFDPAASVTPMVTRVRCASFKPFRFAIASDAHRATPPTKIAKLVGLAPMNHDSGSIRGQRHIIGGRSSVRCVLYMATLTARTFSFFIWATRFFASRG